MWQSLGFATQFALGFYVKDFNIKLYYVAATLVLSALSLFVLNSRQKLDRARSSDSESVPLTYP